MKNLAILIPCYNEEQTISKVIEDFGLASLALADDYKTTIYVFNNASTDNSANLIDEFINDGFFTVKRVDVPLKGKGNAVREMFRQVNADTYIMVDGDLTYSAKDLKDLVQEVEKGADMVIGDRLSSTYYTENKRLFHNFGNKLVKRLINNLYKTEISDVMTGYRAFSKRFIKCMFVASNGFQIETEMTIFALKNHFNVTSIPVSYKDRPEGSSSKLNTIQDGARVLMTIAKEEIFNHPLKYFAIDGLALFILGLFTYSFLVVLGVLMLLISILGELFVYHLNEIKALHIKEILNEANKD